MVKYWVKTPLWLKWIFAKHLVWEMPRGHELSVYLTFDDGPHPVATPFIIDQLDKYEGKATFFCIGKNVVLYPEIYTHIQDRGHTVANHTHNHLNGWKTNDATYLDNIKQAAAYINSHCMRPPYGRIKRAQARALRNMDPSWTIYMWDVLSADFDRGITPEKCLDNVIKNIRPGSIVVFHDSDKAWERMSYALPRVLQYCKQKDWKLKSLPKN